MSLNVGFAYWIEYLGVTLAGTRRVRASYTAPSMGTLVFVFLNSNFQAVNRYVLFPVVFIIVSSRLLQREER